MPSYVITGSSKGLGFAFLEHLSKQPSNKVIGLARHKDSLEAKLKKAGITSVTVLEADVGDLSSLKIAAEATGKITGGGLDVLINNAGLVSGVSEFKALSEFDSNPEDLDEDMINSFRVNALGLLHSIQAFLPLIRKGTVKKVVNISTGMADLDLINDTAVEVAAPYAASKAAANVVIAKYNAAHKNEGILFLSISPGYVATERNFESIESKHSLRGLMFGEVTEQYVDEFIADAKKAQELGGKFATYAPHFTRMLTTEESVSSVLKVIDQKSVSAGDGGKFISHLGNQQWL